MVRSMMLFIAACLLLLLDGKAVLSAENCRECHKHKALIVQGAHAKLSCLSCHLGRGTLVANPAASANAAEGCGRCHKGYAAVFQQSMGTRKAERHFVERTFGRMDRGFFEKNCNSCHLSGCTDCHGGKGHQLAQPRDRGCFACHKGYFVGTDYYGMAPREENLRYQRGDRPYGETFLKMLPDVHAEAGLSCGACHSMASMVAGKHSSKQCLDCHKPKRSVIEHGISAHMEKLECYACHSAWAAQEYGTFYLRFTESSSQDDFRLATNNGGEYVKSVYLRKQDAPPLGLNARGKVSPIRPQFISYFSDIRGNRPYGQENRLLGAEWKAFFPHTIRRGSVMCEGCHDTPRRFIMEPPGERIYQLQKEGMTLPSFWDRSGQQVYNGSFLPPGRYLQLSKKSPAYQRAYLKKWQSLVNRVENSSGR